MDNTVRLLAEGYAWLPDRRRRMPTVQTRLMGQRAVCLGGVDAARFFYDERNIRRHGALPEPVLSTLFGRLGRVDGIGKLTQCREVVRGQVLQIGGAVEEVTRRRTSQ